MQTITILIPIYNNAFTLQNLYDSIQTSIQQFSDFNIKILFVDDASTDNSFKIMKQMKDNNATISLLQLAYNHTQQYAFFAAINYIKSDYLIYLSADIQEETTILGKYLDAIKQDKITELFIGFRQANNDFLIFKILSKLFYKLIRRKIPNMPEGGFDTGCASQSLLQKFIRNFKKKDLVQATLVQNANQVKLIPYTRQKSSSDGIKMKSLIFKIKYFIFSLISVYSKNKNKDDIYFSVKQYIP